MSEIIYQSPPIREAIFDIRFKFKEPINLNSLEEAFLELQEQYPKKETTNIQSVSFEVKLGEAPKVSSSGGANGLRLTSSDFTKVVQLRNDGFTFSQLKPYKEWEDFIEEGRRLLSVYLNKVQPEYAERIALRYINGIDIPESNFKIEDYFLTSPKIGEEVPQGLVHFFSRLVLKDDEDDNFAIINQTIEENGKNDITTVLFDIDAFRSNLRTEPNTEDFWQIVESLKTFRTRIFEGSLTKKTKELFS